MRRDKSLRGSLRAYRAAVRMLLEQVSRRNQVLSSMRSELNELLKNPLGKLLWTYSRRPDLQQAFSEVRGGDYSRLLEWATEQAVSGEDSAHQLFADHAPWYEANPWRRLSELSDELNRMKTELSQRESEISKLSEELKRTKCEFDIVRRSFGYKIMRSYASVIDKLLPNGTLRGKFRKNVTLRLQELI